jgi:hypothetical protein
LKKINFHSKRAKYLFIDLKDFQAPEEASNNSGTAETLLLKTSYVLLSLERGDSFLLLDLYPLPRLGIQIWIH